VTTLTLFVAVPAVAEAFEYGVGSIAALTAAVEVEHY